MERPYLGDSGEALMARVLDNWNDFEGLGILLYELQHRAHIPKELKAATVERVLELAFKASEGYPATPGFEFPSVDLAEGRRQKVAGLGHVDWRSQGLLSMTGYRVGAANGVREDRRRRILNWVFLEDDLNIVDDLAYKAEWGAPRSSQRLQKLANTLAAFIRNALRNNPGIMVIAIEEWESDLLYLKHTFYDRWNDFPWPNVDVQL